MMIRVLFLIFFLSLFLSAASQRCRFDEQCENLSYPGRPEPRRGGPRRKCLTIRRGLYECADCYTDSHCSSRREVEVRRDCPLSNLSIPSTARGPTVLRCTGGAEDREAESSMLRTVFCFKKIKIKKHNFFISKLHFLTFLD